MSTSQRFAGKSMNTQPNVTNEYSMIIYWFHRITSNCHKPAQFIIFCTFLTIHLHVFTEKNAKNHHIFYILFFALTSWYKNRYDYFLCIYDNLECIPFIISKFHWKRFCIRKVRVVWILYTRHCQFIPSEWTSIPCEWTFIPCEWTYFCFWIEPWWTKKFSFFNYKILSNYYYNDF